MHEIARCSGSHVRRPSNELELESQGVCDPGDQVERRIGPTSFDGRDICRRYPEPRSPVLAA
jgi:hypothetical protein